MFPLDVEILHFVQSSQPDWLTLVMRVFSWLCTPEIVVPVVGAVLVSLTLKHKRWQEATVLAIMGGNSFTLLLKPLFHVARPIADQAVILDHQGSYGFPSGHALAAITIGAALVLMAHHRRRASWWLIVLVTLFVFMVGVSRVYLGAHWPSDVLGGWLIGWIWSLIIWRFVRPRLQQALPPST